MTGPIAEGMPSSPTHTSQQRSLACGKSGQELDCGTRSLQMACENHAKNATLRALAWKLDKQLCKQAVFDMINPYPAFPAFVI